MKVSISSQEIKGEIEREREGGRERRREKERDVSDRQKKASERRGGKGH